MASSYYPEKRVEVSRVKIALNEDDLYEIVQKLASIAIRWRRIGMALGLRQETLDKIEHRYHDLDDQLINMVSEWLKRNYTVEKFGEPTWRKLVEAVGATTGGANAALAQAIAKKHCVIYTRVESVRMNTAMPMRGTPVIQQENCHSRWNWNCCCFRRRHGRHSNTATYSTNVAFEDDSFTAERTYSTASSSSRDLVQALPTWKFDHIKDHPIYHGALTGEEAELKLQDHNGGNCYLIRYSEQRKTHVLTVLRRNEANPDKPFKAHFTLNITKKNGCNCYEVEGAEKSFANINSLLAFYEKNPLTATITCIGEPYVRTSKQKNVTK